MPSLTLFRVAYFRREVGTSPAAPIENEDDTAGERFLADIARVSPSTGWAHGDAQMSSEASAS
jgi:hypothetical protein